MKGICTVIACAILPAMATGCGEAHSDDAGSADPNRNTASNEQVNDRAATAGDHIALDCPSKWRASGTWEGGWDGIDAYSSPAAVARPFVDDEAGESVVVMNNKQDGHRARAWILRPDGTARAELSILYRDDHGGWYLSTFETCDREPLMGDQTHRSSA